MELIPRWFKTSEDMPPEERSKYLPDFYPFVSKGVKLPHYGCWDEDEKKWWCQECRKYIEHKDVIAWFALPFYKE